MAFFKFIAKKFSINPFVVEILKKNGFDNFAKLKVILFPLLVDYQFIIFHLQLLKDRVINEMLREAEQDLENYKEFQEHYPEVYEKYVKTKEKGVPFTLKLLVGDRNILFEMPEAIANRDDHNLIRLYKLCFL